MSAPTAPEPGDSVPQAQAEESQQRAGPPAPSTPAYPLVRRTFRGGARKKAKGLPADAVLQSLAILYAAEQRKHWPELAACGVLPNPADPDAIAHMVAQFKDRHLSGIVPVLDPALLELMLACCYSRFSDENSKTTSISDQLHRELTKAKADGYFIPWAWCFADYAVTGLDCSRTDYSNAKVLISNSACRVMYIDDFTRASRSALEWWKLAALCKRHNCNLIGVDGFNLAHENADFQIAISGVFASHFIDQLTRKVRRGLQGSARRGTSTGRPAFGYLLTAVTDPTGALVLGPDGVPLMKPAIDPQLSCFVLEAFDRYGVQHGTLGEIARSFNERNVGGGSSWSPGTISGLLKRRIYIGDFTYNLTHQERDHETNRVRVVKNPPEVWIREDRQYLRIVPDKLWELVQNRLLQAKLGWTNRKNSRAGASNVVSRTGYKKPTLFSGTLKCGSCGADIVLARSATGYRQLGCRLGVNQLHGCILNSTKSAERVERTLLKYLQQQLAGDATIRRLVDRAAEASAALAQKPLEDTRPLESALRGLEVKTERVLESIAAQAIPAVREQLVGKLGSLEQEKASVRSRLSELRQLVVEQKQPPVTAQEVEAHLQNLQRLLSGAQSDQSLVPRAANVLRSIFRSVTVTSKPSRGGGYRRNDWILTFTPDLGALGPRSPAASAAALVSHVENVVLSVDPPQRAVCISGEVLKLRDAAFAQGMKPSISAIASALDESYATVRRSMIYLETGEIPHWAAQSPKKRRKSVANTAASRLAERNPAYIRYGATATRLLDEEGLTLKAAALRLGVCTSTVARARSHFLRSTGTVATGCRHKTRGVARKLTPETISRIHELKKIGKSVGFISSACSLGASSVYRVLRSPPFAASTH